MKSNRLFHVKNVLKVWDDMNSENNVYLWIYFTPTHYESLKTSLKTIIFVDVRYFIPGS